MYSVVLDTCVLYPTYLRDTLLRAASAGLYRPLWSEDILAELHRNLAELIGDDRATTIDGLLRTHFGDAVVSGYEPLIPVMRNHEKDRHVLAAAVRANVGAILTFNEADFPSHTTTPFGVDVIHPDRFLLDLLDLAPGRFMATLEAQVLGYRKPEMTISDLTLRLQASGCPDFAAELLHHLP